MPHGVTSMEVGRFTTAYYGPSGKFAGSDFDFTSAEREVPGFKQLSIADAVLVLKADAAAAPARIDR